MLCQWHPSANFTLASASFSGAIKIWDVQKEVSPMDYQKSNSAPWCMKWNYDGSLLGCINKNKQMHLYDPRSPDTAIVTNAHGGTKPQRMSWIRDSGKILTVGSSEFNEREWAVYDTRGDMSKPLVQQKLDN
jgi:WD40 repeat protein